MRAARFGETPPPALTTAWQCERWNCLPDAGGYLDQEARLMQHMTTLSNVYQVVARLAGMTGAQIHQLSDGERRLIGWLMREELWQT